MDLKWAEDLIVLARTGHFTRAAEARLVTQSALSRRIQSLEQWAGTELVDRGRHPISLTPAGQEFLSAAEDIVNKAYEAQSIASNNMFVSQSEVRISTLHALSMKIVPDLIADVQNYAGDFTVSIDSSARSLQEDLHKLKAGICDIFISVDHPELEISLDPAVFERVQIMTETQHLYARDPAMFGLLEEGCTEQVPFITLNRSATSSLAMQRMLADAPFFHRMKTVYRATMSASLKEAVKQRLGIAWLPDSIVKREVGEGVLTPYQGGYSIEKKVIAFRSVKNERPIVSRIWEGVEEIGRNFMASKNA